MSRDPRIDSYIARQADFAKPILTHLRAILHRGCPEVTETIKWGMPSFTYKGRPMATMAAFKAHATFGFWQGSQVTGSNKQQNSGMGQFGKLTSVEDLPDALALVGLVEKAAGLIDAGTKPTRMRTSKPPLEMPADFASALDAGKDARGIFDSFSPSAKRDYLEWILEAKRPQTRASRIGQAVEWIAQRKKRHWKYEEC